jgi:putative membrane protein
MVVPASDRYASVPLAWAGLAALTVGALLALFWQAIGLRLGFFLEAAAFGSVALVLEWMPLRLLLVPKHLKRMRARSLAHREFGAAILSADKPQGGLLFFVSLGERYVEIVADRIVHARIGEAAWNSIVADFTTHAGRGQLAGALARAIEACAAHLETHFPQTAAEAVE